MSDPKLSVQPWKTPAGNWLIYNGEIFNYPQLIAQSNWTPKTTCDTEYLSYALSRMPSEKVNDHIPIEKLKKFFPFFPQNLMIL